MTGRKSLPWPLWAIAFDLIGTLLAGFGLYLLIGQGQGPESNGADVQGIAIPMIVFGVLLMAPLITIVMRKSLSSR